MMVACVYEKGKEKERARPGICECIMEGPKQHFFNYTALSFNVRSGQQLPLGWNPS